MTREPETGTTGETEGARRATGVSPVVPVVVVPDPAVAEKATRRRFSAEYKLRIVLLADACKEPGELGSLLRREGLYSSHLVAWRRQREQLSKPAMAGKKRGPQALAAHPRLRQLERENTRLKHQLERAHLVIDIQKKASTLLGITLDSDEID
jgi:transposase-like protein